MGFHLGTFLTQVGFHDVWWNKGPAKKIQLLWHLQKKTKCNLSESNSKNDAAVFARFIVIESLVEVCLAKFSPFLIEKVISMRDILKTVKKIRNSNLLVEVDSWRQAESILKMKTFHTIKCRAYSHEKPNIFKGVFRSMELALATEEEIASGS